MRAIAGEAGTPLIVQETQLTPPELALVVDESTGLLIDPGTGNMYDPETRQLVVLNLAETTSTSPEKSEYPHAKPTSPGVPSAVQDTTASAMTNVAGGFDGFAQVSGPQASTPIQPEASEPSLNAEAEELFDAPASPESSFISVDDDGSTVDTMVVELQVASRLLDAGWTPEMIAAALGNIYAESGSNPKSFCDMSGMFNYGYEVAGGLFQWTDAGASATDLSCAGLTGLKHYADQKGGQWTDLDVQIDYFLKTWREGWAERQTYYDSAYPEYTGVDVSLRSFDEGKCGDFDEDGIIDSRDEDIDGDGILNESDPVQARVVDGVVVRSKSASVSKKMSGIISKKDRDVSEQHVANLTFIFMAGYEGPSANVAHLERRISHAQRIYPAVLALEETQDLNTMSKDAGMVVAGAGAMLGGAYVWAAEAPEIKNFDCSGLTKWCYSLVGIDLDHYSETQYQQADKVNDVADALPGDILWKPGHVGIYIGNGKTIEAKGSKYGIVYGEASSFEAALHFDALDKQIKATEVHDSHIQELLSSLQAL